MIYLNTLAEAEAAAHALMLEEQSLAAGEDPTYERDDQEAAKDAEDRANRELAWGEGVMLDKVSDKNLSVGGMIAGFLIMFGSAVAVDTYHLYSWIVTGISGLYLFCAASRLWLISREDDK